MKKNILIFSAVLAANATVTGNVFATSVSYYLDSSNQSTLFPTGTDYLQVTIDDLGIANDKIYFTVTPLPPLTSIASNHFASGLLGMVGVSRRGVNGSADTIG